MKVPFLHSRLAKTIHYRRKIMGKSFTHSWWDSGKQYKRGLVQIFHITTKNILLKVLCDKAENTKLQ